nr:hypothetical protein [Burkholderia ubonensis]
MYGDDVAARHDDLLRVAARPRELQAAHRGRDGLSGSKLAGGIVQHFADGFDARHARLIAQRPEVARAKIGFGAVEPERANANPDFVVAGIPNRDVLQLQDVRAAEAFNDIGLHEHSRCTSGARDAIAVTGVSIVTPDGIRFHMHCPKCDKLRDDGASGRRWPSNARHSG